MRRRLIALAGIMLVGASVGYAQNPGIALLPSAEAVQDVLGPEGIGQLATAQSGLFTVAGCAAFAVSGKGLVLTARSCLEARLPGAAESDGPIALDVASNRPFDAVVLEFAPEPEVAAFGNSPLYPSYRFDVAVLRLLRAGQPLETPVHFSVLGAESAAGDAVLELRAGVAAAGEVRGFRFNGTLAMAHTLLFGMLDRHQGHGGDGDWSLPPHWADAGQMVDLSTPVNLAATTPGTAGAALVNPNFELVGLVIGRSDGAEPRAVALDVRGLRTVLSTLYPAESLVEEMTGGAR